MTDEAALGDLATRAELSWMGEVSRRGGVPVSFGLTQHDSRPDLYERVVAFAKEENATGAQVRPQTTARSVGECWVRMARNARDWPLGRAKNAGKAGDFACAMRKFAQNG